MDGRSPVDFETTEELRRFAQKYSNWGDFPTLLFEVIRNPKCDKGTALHVFWSSDPVSFFELYADEEEALKAGEYSRDYYQLLVELQEKYVEGFYLESDFYVDPEKETGGDFISDKLKTQIADIMRRPSL